MNIRIISILLVIAACCVTSCKQQKSTPTTAVVNEGIVMHNQDTVQVINLVKEFMDALKDKKYADAVIRLHKINPKKPYAEPELLNNEEIDKAMKDLKRFPIRNYEIKDYTFNICYDNLVRCSIELESNNEGATPAKLTFALNPVRYLGEWRLCLK